MLARLDAANQRMNYPSLYETFTRSVRRAIRESDLAAEQKMEVLLWIVNV